MSGAQFHYTYDPIRTNQISRVTSDHGAGTAILSDTTTGYDDRGNIITIDTRIDDNAATAPGHIATRTVWQTTTISYGATTLTVSPLVPVASSYAFGVSPTQLAPGLTADATESDQTMEAWMQGLSQSISSAFLKEMEQAMRNR